MKEISEDKLEKKVLDSNNLLEKSAYALFLAAVIAINVMSYQEDRDTKFHSIPQVKTLDSIHNIQFNDYRLKLDSLRKVYADSLDYKLEK